MVSIMFLFYKILLKLNFTLHNFYFGGMWLMPYLSTYLLIPLLGLGKYFLKNFDHSWLEKLSGQGVYLFASANRLKIDKFNILNLKSYLMFFFFLLILFFIYI
jgi:hypothetical protein